MIIGITGTLGAGKGTIVEYLKQKGFSHYSVREFLIQELKKRGMEINRDNMVSLANELRAEKGSSYIVEELYKEAAKNKGKCIIESLRTVGEVEALREKSGFVFFAVDADVKTRYERVVQRKSSTDDISFEKFVEDEKREMSSDDPNKQNLARCIEMADYIFNNDSGFDELFEQVEKTLNEIAFEDYKKSLEEKPRPEWDEYFIKAAALVAERSTCKRHHVGAIIVRDKRIITTGYNGAAKGVKDCSQLGCLKDEQNLASGMGYETCRAIHGEQNAIIQGAANGISVNGGTMYCTHTPCMICAKAIVNAGIKEVVSYQDFKGDMGARDFLASAGVLLRQVNRPSSEISFKD